ncbi:unnamed protein product [Rhizophagus irregularis]|nr:unnamed protein product [Rhizophagus irregularis]
MKGCPDFKETNKEDEELRLIRIETDTPINTALPKKNYLHIKGDNQKGFNQFLSRFEITLKFYLLGNRILRSCFDCSHNSGAAQTLFMIKRKSRTDYYSIKYL